MRRITRTVLATAALVVASAATADACGTWQGTLTVVGNGADPGSVSAQGRHYEMEYCVWGQPIGTARVVANTPGTVTVAVSPSSGACASTTLPNGTYDIRWAPGAWSLDDPDINECGGTTDIGDITVASGSGGPVVSEVFDPGDPGTIQICVTKGLYGMQVPVSVVAASPTTSTTIPATTTTTAPDECEDAEVGSGPVHHIATNKNDISSARGGPWTPRFKPLFDNAGLDMDGALNKVSVVGHRGPHPQPYHQAVFRRILESVSDLAPGTPEYRAAFEAELRALAEDVSTPGNALNDMVKNPSYEC